MLPSLAFVASPRFTKILGASWNDYSSTLGFHLDGFTDKTIADLLELRFQKPFLILTIWSDVHSIIVIIPGGTHSLVRLCGMPETVQPQSWMNCGCVSKLCAVANILQANITRFWSPRFDSPLQHQCHAPQEYLFHGLQKNCGTQGRSDGEPWWKLPALEWMAGTVADSVHSSTSGDGHLLKTFRWLGPSRKSCGGRFEVATTTAPNSKRTEKIRFMMIASPVTPRVSSVSWGLDIAFCRLEAWWPMKLHGGNRFQTLKLWCSGTNVRDLELVEAQEPGFFYHVLCTWHA